MTDADRLDEGLESAIADHARSERDYEELLSSLGLTREELGRLGAGGYLPAARRRILAAAIEQAVMSDDDGGGHPPAAPLAPVAVPPHAVRV
jgi:hypothetical protein